MLHSICQQIWKTQQWPQDWTRSVFIPTTKGSAKECSNYSTIVLISHARKVMLKILQARLQQYMNWEIPDIHTRYRKGRGTRDQTANIHRITEKAREFQKYIYFCFTDYARTYAWTARRSNQSIPKEIDPEYLLEGLMLKLQYSATSCKEPTGKDPCVGKRRRQQDEMVEWHHWPNGHEFEATLVESEGQGSLVCCCLWGHKVSDTSEQLNNNNKILTAQKGR